MLNLTKKADPPGSKAPRDPRDPRVAETVTSYWNYDFGCHHERGRSHHGKLEEKILISKNCGDINVLKFSKEIYFEQ